MNKLCVGVVYPFCLRRAICGGSGFLDVASQSGVSVTALRDCSYVLYRIGCIRYCETGRKSWRLCCIVRQEWEEQLARKRLKKLSKQGIKPIKLIEQEAVLAIYRVL